MAKGIYVGVSGKARKVKKLYIGVNGKARKVKKAYIGVNGKARLFYSAWGDTLPTYSNTLTDVSYQRKNSLPGSIGSYAIFAGGVTSSSGQYATTNFDAYNSAGTRTVGSTFPDPYACCNGIAVNNGSVLALMNFGTTTASGSNVYSTFGIVYTINPSLTVAKVVEMNSETDVAFSSVAELNGNIFFHGGCRMQNGSTVGYLDKAKIYKYNTSFTKSTIAISSSMLQTTNNAGTASATIGGYALLQADPANDNFAYSINSSSTIGKVNFLTTNPGSVWRGDEDNSVNNSYAFFSAYTDNAYTYNANQIWDTVNPSLTRGTVNLGVYATGVSKHQPYIRRSGVALHYGKYFVHAKCEQTQEGDYYLMFVDGSLTKTLVKPKSSMANGNYWQLANADGTLMIMIPSMTTTGGIELYKAS